MITCPWLRFPGLVSEACLPIFATILTISAIHPQHKKYNKQKVDHEAGYDSMLTAKVFIKLSAQLREGGPSKCSGTTPLALTGNQDLRGSPPDIVDERPAKPSRLESGQAAFLSIHENNKTSPTGQEATEDPEATNIGHRTKFDTLPVGDAADNMDLDKPPSVDKADEVEIMQMVNRGELIPRIEAEFWKTYSNKLRVFGTEERVCVIGPQQGKPQMDLPFKPTA